MALPSAPDTTPAMDDDQQARPEDKKRERSEDPVEELPNAKRSKNSVTNSAAVQSHYDARPNMGHFEREHSPIIGLRRFNNWVKSVLIGSYVREGDIVLDICGGKGGDMPKWTHGRISHLVLVGATLPGKFVNGFTPTITCMWYI
jgi:mRNA (guanine-N7-)-methyltransferase